MSYLFKWKIHRFLSFSFVSSK